MNRTTMERRKKIREMLLTAGSVNSSDASNLFAVSTETIRKDLLFLEKQGIAKKGYGGAVAATDYIETPFEKRNDKNVEAKSRIAARAMEFIPERGVILLDAGSTTLLLAKQIAACQGLTIITNSISVCNALCSSNNYVYIIGGQVKSATMSLVGLWSSNCLDSINIDIAFLGTSGFMNFAGPCAESFSEAELKKKIIERSNMSVVLADSSKFRSNALAQYALWSEIDILVTDQEPESEYERMKQMRQSTQLVLA